MARRFQSPDSDLEWAVLRFWAHGVSLSQQFSPAEIASVPGLADAIDAIRDLPQALGREDDKDLSAGGTVHVLDIHQGLRKD